MNPVDSLVGKLAVTVVQSSQYHHLLSSAFQGGNFTQDAYRQFGQGEVMPSLSTSKAVVTIIRTTLKINPIKRHKTLRSLVTRFVGIPKKSDDSLSIVLNPHKKPYNIPPICVKLSTYGVSPMTQLMIMSTISHTTTMICLHVVPESSELTCLLKSSLQLMTMSAKHAPMRPNIPPDAPTLMYSGRKIALKIVPPAAGMIKMIAAATKPWFCSTALPINHNASMFNR
mmetsp:Transcript_15214/g.20137  ORF Transcript_15214/g.20137 Transcript_15214/m.20137 type:complete len:227 (+) Transcript_15214:273-953(+)